MRTAHRKVLEFHIAIGEHIAEEPALLPCETEHAKLLANDLRELSARAESLASPSGALFGRLALALEELAEWLESHANGDLVAAADALGDRLYVLLGDAVATGLPLSAIFDEIHRSNMTKAAGRSSTGKAVKPADYERPRLKSILKAAQLGAARRRARQATAPLAEPVGSASAPEIPKLDMVAVLQKLAQKRAASKTDRHRRMPTVLEVLAQPYLEARELGYEALKQAIQRDFHENPDLIKSLLQYLKDQEVQLGKEPR